MAFPGCNLLSVSGVSEGSAARPAKAAGKAMMDEKGNNKKPSYEAKIVDQDERAVVYSI